jgi:hypothetical protein
MRLAIAAIFALMFTGCAGKGSETLEDAEAQAFSDLRAEIRVAISDEDRKTEAIAIVDKLAEELESLRSLKAERQRQGRMLNANYDSTRAEFEALGKLSDTEIQLNKQRILRLRSDFMATTTPDEWEQISEVRTEAIVAAIQATHSI